MEPIFSVEGVPGYEKFDILCSTLYCDDMKLYFHMFRLKKNAHEYVLKNYFCSCKYWFI